MIINYSEAKKQLGKLIWYMQGAAVKPLTISYPLYACTQMKIFGKIIPCHFEIVIYYQNNFMQNYLSTRSLKKVAKYYYTKQKKDQKFINNLFLNWQKSYVAPYLQIIAQIDQENLSSYSNTKLLVLFQKFNKTYLDVWQESIFLDSFDYYSEEILRQILKEEKKEIDEKDLNLLISPLQPTFAQKEKIALAKIASKILNNPKIAKDIIKIKNFSTVSKKYPQILSLLENHRQNYHWLGNDYAQVVELDSRYFFHRLIKLLSNREEITKEYSFQQTFQNLEKKKQSITKRYKLSDNFTNITNFLAFLGNFRDYRKSYNQMGNAVAKRFAKEFSQRTKQSLQAAESFLFWEAEKIFQYPAEKFVKTSQRQKSVIWFFYGSLAQHWEITGSESHSLNSYISKLVKNRSGLFGRIAYPGLVRGKVKIINGQENFSKMKKGDILVAPNTRPEYLPIMKKAGAIVSVEGGITCHTAIVSRELGIPCLVGVQSATIVLKDGDLVEVDANEGIVKIIKRKQ